MTIGEEDEVSYYCYSKGIACRFVAARRGDGARLRLIYISYRDAADPAKPRFIRFESRRSAAATKRLIRAMERAGYFEDWSKYARAVLLPQVLGHPPSATASSNLA